MKRKNRILFLLFAFLCYSSGHLGYAASDSMRQLSQTEFLSIVREYHPVVKQARLGVDKARAQVRESRGAFDPKANASLDQKTFGGKGYYDYFKGELKVPTWFGIDVKAGIEDVGGDYANNEYTKGRVSYAGVETGLQNLLFDKRRAVLRQSQTFLQLSRAEQELLINELLYDAIAQYWQWVQSYENYRIVQEALAISEDRFRFVKIQFRQGDNPAIDTTEALSQLQSMQVQEQEARMQWLNAGLELNNFVWTEELRPFVWHENIVPPDNHMQDSVPGLPLLHELLDDMGPDHPKLQSIQYKKTYYEIEKRLKMQMFLPQLTVSANLLQRDYTLPGQWDRYLFENNHKIGLDLSIPLFMRKERGGFQQAKIKIAEMELDFARSSLELENKLKAYYNEAVALRTQMEIFEDAVNNYQRMFQGENTRFQNGESTLFLMNNRQNKVLEASQKLLALKAKYRKAYAALLKTAAALD